MNDADIAALAAEILAVGDAAGQMAPITALRPDFTLSDAYRVSADITARRVARGEQRLGWKIGFTNRTIWDEYDVHAPIWGPVYSTTVVNVGPDYRATVDIAPLVEPRIEPEIVFRLGAAPDPAMDEAALMECIDGVAHGFEIVQSLFPDWRFSVADTAAAFALHGRLLAGPFLDISDEGQRATWLRDLADFEMKLDRDGVEIDRGHGSNVLDSPVSALLHFIRGLDATSGERLRPGDIVTTGTVTRAFPVARGETWQSQVIGLPLKGLTLTIA